MGYDSETAILNRQDWDLTLTTEVDANQAGATLLTPTSGKSLSVKGVYINTEASSGAFRLYFGTSNNSIIKIFAAKVPCSGYVPVFLEGSRNEPIKFTSDLGADQNVFILINYKEK